MTAREDVAASLRSSAADLAQVAARWPTRPGVIPAREAVAEAQAILLDAAVGLIERTAV